MNIKEQAMALEIPVNRKPCIYFLTDENGEILYIGKSKKSLFGRISTHEYTKQFSRAFFITCSGYKEMDELEARLILKIKPKYNQAINGKILELLSIKDIRKKINVEARIIHSAAFGSKVEMIMVGNQKYYGQNILPAINFYIARLKRKPLSLDHQVWKSIKGQ